MDNLIINNIKPLLEDILHQMSTDSDLDLITGTNKYKVLINEIKNSLEAINKTESIKKTDKTIKFDIVNHGERAAGIAAYTDELTIIIDSGDPGGVPGEFEAFMIDCLKEWYDGANITEIK